MVMVMLVVARIGGIGCGGVSFLMLLQVVSNVAAREHATLEEVL